MISAIADTCSVRLDKTNKKVYRFRALVFHQDAEGNNKEAYLKRENSIKADAPQARVKRGILSRQPKTEWKCAYNELLNERKKEDILASPLRKRSKTSMDVSSDCDTLKKERQKVRFKESETLDPEAETCPTCLQIIAKDTKDYDSLMDKSKEELVTMIVNHNISLQNRNIRRRKNGYSPTDNDIAQLKQLDISNTEQSPSTKTKPTRARRKLGRSCRLTSI